MSPRREMWQEISLTTAVQCVLVAWLSACFVYVFTYAMIPGEILSGYGSIVRRWAEAGGWRRTVVKPLGGCGFCTAFWVGFFFSAAFGGVLWWLAPFVGCAAAVWYNLIDSRINSI